MFSLSSPVFANNTPLPRRYTAEGENVSPPLIWSDVPAGTQSLALVVDDPDAPDPRAPQRTWVHWVLYDLPADTRALPVNAASQGLPKLAHPTKAELMTAMKGHVLGRAELVGTYEMAR